ncbi:hypothetical protein KFK09_019468 [Dendrobium nobile]|uniref:Uncharacterized protein n=1 Tax=Dendrobium nobile TaxID=94219 RepID=A0A8T3AR22_DENNO|nr:hypothetical protein KFK09_019468 [Dendrobium nobile]
MNRRPQQLTNNSKNPNSPCIAVREMAPNFRLFLSRQFKEQNHSPSPKAVRKKRSQNRASHFQNCSHLLSGRQNRASSLETASSLPLNPLSIRKKAECPPAVRKGLLQFATPAPSLAFAHTEDSRLFLL